VLNVPLLIVGDATDGPVEEIVPIQTLDQATRLYGGYTYERTVVTSGTTGYTLSVLPWAGQVVPMREDSDGFLIPTSLFEFAVNGTQLSWTQSGQLASGRITFQVLAEPGENSVLKGVYAARKTGVLMHALRIGGEDASATQSGFRFQSIYAGSRYNGTTIFVSGGQVTVTPSAGAGRITSYQPVTDEALADLLRDDLARGFLRIFLTGPLSRTALTLPSGTYTLAGGTDGSFTDSDFAEFVEVHELDGVDVLLPVGLSTVEVADAVDLLADSSLYPTLVVAQVPATGAALASYPNTRRNLCAVGFQLHYDVGDPKERVDDGAPMVAAIAANDLFGLTLAKLPEAPPEPRYTPTQLTQFAASGITLAYNSISKGWALWHVVTGDAAWPVSTFRALQEIARPIYNTLNPVIGETLLDLDSLRDLLATAFAQVEGSRVLDWNLELRGQVLYLDIEFTPWGEIRVIKAQMVLGTPHSASPI
jgi:hypothetical protein